MVVAIIWPVSVPLPFTTAASISCIMQIFTPAIYNCTVLVVSKNLQVLHDSKVLCPI
jgi:hypothetical protein